MSLARSRLSTAIAASVVLHALLLVAGGGQLAAPGASAPHADPLNVTLRPVQAPAPVESLQLPETSLGERERAKDRNRKKAGIEPPRPRRSASTDAARVNPSAGSFPTLSGEGERQAKLQIARELLYPPEAIARGLEGEALVLLVLDEAGNAMAARLEATSGHALLDAAAVRAARTLRGLPDSVPREVLLPVRFRLR